MGRERASIFLFLESRCLVVVAAAVLVVGVSETEEHFVSVIVSSEKLGVAVFCLEAELELG